MFNFGASSEKKSADAPAPAPSAGFTFTPFAASAKPALAGGDTATSATASSSGDAEESPAAEQAKQGLVRNLSVHDMAGEGEENEETVAEVRGKVYAMSKKSDGTQEWLDRGIGIAKLKKHKETGARRLLMRNSSTGRIILVRFSMLNFPFWT